MWLVKFEGVDTPEQASALQGHTLLIRAEDREPLEDEDEFYVQDLIGMEVSKLLMKHLKFGRDRA